MKPNFLIFLFFLPCGALANNILAKKVNEDLGKNADPQAHYWSQVPEVEVALMAQPMMKPKPEKVETSSLKVQALHDGKYIAFRLRWKDTDKSEAGKLGEFSDAVALEFPVKSNDNPPSVIMGEPGNPVHMFHWRAQYQHDEVYGKKDVKDIYPNLSVDAYHMDYPDNGKWKGATSDQKAAYMHGMAAGNPQSYPKKAVDEIMAEGFGSSAVREDRDSLAQGEWKNGEWTVVISRALKRKKGSVLEPGKGSVVAFAVWQGGKEEVGSRKALTLFWTPVKAEGL